MKLSQVYADPETVETIIDAISTEESHSEYVLFTEKYPPLLSVDLFGRKWDLSPFALCVVIAAFLGLGMLWFSSRRSGLKKGTAGTLALLLPPLGLLFARVFYVLAGLGWYEEIGLVRALYLWEGGYAMWGALLGFALAALLASLLAHERASVLLDACAAPAALFIALCRLAAWPFSGEGLGRLVDSDSLFCRFPFAVQDEAGEWRWAVFLLEFVIALVILHFLLASRRKDGEKAGLFLILYGASQILCESLHGNAGKMVWHQFVRVPQLMSALVLAALFIAGAVRRIRASSPVRLSGRRIAELSLFLFHGLALVIAMEFARDKSLMLPAWVCGLIIADGCFMIGYAVYAYGLIRRTSSSAPLSAGRAVELSALLVLGAAIIAGMVIAVSRPLVLPVGLCYLIMACSCFMIGFAVFQAVLSPGKEGA